MFRIVSNCLLYPLRKKGSTSRSTAAWSHSSLLRLRYVATATSSKKQFCQIMATSSSVRFFIIFDVKFLFKILLRVRNSKSFLRRNSKILTRGMFFDSEPVEQLKKNLANKIFGYEARCDFWAKLGLRFWILLG